MTRVRTKSHIELPKTSKKFPPKTREEAVARLHFHFNTLESHSLAVTELDKFLSEWGLDESYYWVINKRDQIISSIPAMDEPQGNSK